MKEINDYIEKTIQLESEGNKFPGNLEEIWQMKEFSKRYERKAMAILDLKDRFKENIDYVFTPRKKIIGHGQGQVGKDYFLSSSCVKQFLLSNVEERGLTKLDASSTPGQIETYFRKVSELYDSGQDFPVDLDEVYPLVYIKDRKDHAVRDLKRDFLQDVDYQVFPKIGESLKDRALGGGDLKSTTYKISVSCMEFLVARKVPEVFKVYSEVFHRVRKAMEQPVIDIYSVEYLEGLVQRMKENNARLVLVQEELQMAQKKIEQDVPLVYLAEIAA